ncbi:MAG: hypothetical protein OXE57_01350 [Alphaproteobacteria bacterium]|nr:hypothetical protein [Alphaproteobacteria bacterium]
MNSQSFILSLALVAVLAAPAVANDPACDPLVREALDRRALTGAEAAASLIRHPASGVREPLSIVDFSCGPDLFGYGAFDIFFDPGHAMADIFGLGGVSLCEAAARAWEAGLARRLPDGIFRLHPGGGG